MQELCDLQHCDAMIAAHERRTGRVFDSVLRLRPDLAWEAALSPPNPLLADTVYVPRMNNGNGANDHLAFGARRAMRAFLNRGQYLGLLSRQQVLDGAGARAANHSRLSSEIFLQAALMRHGYNIVRLKDWVYCAVTPRELADHGSAAKGCIARRRAGTHCASLVCPTSRAFCTCSNATCSELYRRGDLPYTHTQACTDTAGRELSSASYV